ncbi:MAG: aldehyde dehydrogenase family protein [Gammaproteobacteria bacterium]|nr:aldehyde dehydrogenase family protein [Gammaproteobacteria bacterium]
MGKKTRRATPKTKNVPVAKTYKLYINGKFPRTESGRYFKLEHKGKVVANVCQASRKDFREAVVAARAAQKGWASASAFLKGQILYRIAEMLEGRHQQFVDELQAQGVLKAPAEAEVDQAIDCLVHYAGWADKYQQIFSAVNPVASSHFNFSVPEPTGVVSLLAPQRSGLLGLVANIAPAIVGGNTVVVLASQRLPLCAISFAEVLHSSDVPGGVVNILTGATDELAGQFASHMDVNAVIYCGTSKQTITEIEEQAANNVKRVITRAGKYAHGPYTIKDTLEIKTTWHPVGA